MAKRRMLFLALAVAVAAIFVTQLQRSGPLGRGKGLEPGADAEGRVPLDPQGSSSVVREEPPLRIQAKRRDQELEIEMTSRTALSQMSVVVQRFEAGSAAAAADTAWNGGMDAGADRQLKFPLPPGTPNTVRFVISARGTDATGGRIAATTVIQP